MFLTLFLKHIPFLEKYVWSTPYTHNLKKNILSTTTTHLFKILTGCLEETVCMH
jgi:hypothetical protein